MIHDPVPRTLQATRVGESVYNITFSINHVGTHVVQVFVGERQAPDSPIMVEVTSKTCSGGKVADVDGDCVCTNKYIDTVRSCASFPCRKKGILLMRRRMYSFVRAVFMPVCVLCVPSSRMCMRLIIRMYDEHTCV